MVFDSTTVGYVSIPVAALHTSLSGHLVHTCAALGLRCAFGALREQDVRKLPCRTLPTAFTAGQMIQAWVILSGLYRGKYKRA